MLRLLPVLLAAGLLLVAVPAFAEDDEDDERGEKDDRRQRRGPPAPIGLFVVQPEAREVQGRHVSFSFDEQGIRGFRAGGQTLFDVVVPDASERPPARASTEGSMIRVSAADFGARVHDNPVAATKVEADGPIVVVFAPGASLDARDGSVRFRVGDVGGRLRGEDLSVSGRNVTSEEEVLLVLDNPRGSFDKNRGDIGEAVARGHVGVEATFNALDSDGVEEEVVSYGNVTMTTVKAERGNLTVLVEGHGLEGRVIVLNVDGRVLGASEAGKLDVLLDNLSIVSASNLSDVLDPDDDGYRPEHYLVYDPTAEAFQLLVSVPHYSVHTLSVKLVEILRPAVTLGILGGLALLVPAALVLFRRRSS